MKPYLKAMWLADAVTLDAQTGKATITGIFDQIEVKAPSTAFTSPAVLFFGLRDGRGKVSLTLRYVDLDDNEILLERSIQVECDALRTADVVLTIPKIPVPHAGAFVWELYHGTDLLGSSRVEAVIS
jgi:hypothetical protein